MIWRCNWSNQRWWHEVYQHEVYRWIWFDLISFGYIVDEMFLRDFHIYFSWDLGTPWFLISLWRVICSRLSTLYSNDTMIFEMKMLRLLCSEKINYQSLITTWLLVQQLFACLEIYYISSSNSSIVLYTSIRYPVIICLYNVSGLIYQKIMYSTYSMVSPLSIVCDHQRSFKTKLPFTFVFCRWINVSVHRHLCRKYDFVSGRRQDNYIATNYLGESYLQLSLLYKRHQ